MSNQAGSNHRLFYAVQSAALAPLGSTTYTNIHGLQSVGVNTNFNLNQIFEIGQLELYNNYEELPEISVTVEKLFDGYPLIYHMATQQGSNGTLVGRSTGRCTLGLSIFGDTQQSASGVPVAQMVASGLYVSSLAYTFPVTGGFSENIGFVGNNKVWQAFTSVAFTNTDVPAYASGVLHRQDIKMGTGSGVCQFPVAIPGIDVSGHNALGSDGTYVSKIQNVRLNANLGRAPLFQLGQRGVYFRYAEFPVQVTSDFECLSLSGDNIQALENQFNLQPETIFIALGDGTTFNLGSQNKLTSVTYGGADASQQGSNATQTFSYLTFNDFTVLNPATDPAGFTS